MTLQYSRGTRADIASKRFEKVGQPILSYPQYSVLMGFLSTFLCQKQGNRAIFRPKQKKRICNLRNEKERYPSNFTVFIHDHYKLKLCDRVCLGSFCGWNNRYQKGNNNYCKAGEKDVGEDHFNGVCRYNGILHAHANQTKIILKPANG